MDQNESRVDFNAISGYLSSRSFRAVSCRIFAARLARRLSVRTPNPIAPIASSTGSIIDKLKARTAFRCVAIVSGAFGARTPLTRSTSVIVSADAGGGQELLVRLLVEPEGGLLFCASGEIRIAK